MMEELRVAFIKAATWHGSMDEAVQLLAADPELAYCDIYTAAITGNVEAVRRFLAEDPANATAISEPYGGNALVYLCMSKYLRLKKERSDDFLKAATLLLDAGADPSSGFWTHGQYPEFETALYGAAGVNYHAPLTELLLKRGADPNDIEAVYHSPEADSDNNFAMYALVETGRLTKESLSIMLIRKHDRHDERGVEYLLAHGADPNGETTRGWYALHHALARCNGLPLIAPLLEYGADPFLVKGGLNAISKAAREGRGDVLALFAQKGISIELEGVDRLIAACAMGNGDHVKAIIEESPALVQELLAIGGDLLARFSLSNNMPGVQLLLHLGVDVNAPNRGDAYFGIPEGSLAIHIAAWLNHPAMVQLLIDSGSIMDMPDGNGQTPLALVVKACVDSYWTRRRSPDAVKALLQAGASAENVGFPSGYKEVDDLLEVSLQK